MNRKGGKRVRPSIVAQALQLGTFGRCGPRRSDLDVLALEDRALGGFAARRSTRFSMLLGAGGELGVLFGPRCEVAQDDLQPLDLVLLERVELVPLEQAALALVHKVAVVAGVSRSCRLQARKSS